MISSVNAYYFTSYCHPLPPILWFFPNIFLKVYASDPEPSESQKCPTYRTKERMVIISIIVQLILLLDSA